jgi:hypothetical protein
LSSSSIGCNSVCSCQMYNYYSIQHSQTITFLKKVVLNCKLPNVFQLKK